MQEMGFRGRQGTEGAQQVAAGRLGTRKTGIVLTRGGTGKPRAATSPKVAQVDTKEGSCLCKGGDKCCTGKEGADAGMKDQPWETRLL